MIIATLSDFKLFWDLLDNTDTTPDNHRAELGLQIEAQRNFLRAFAFDPDLILNEGDVASEGNVTYSCCQYFFYFILSSAENWWTNL